MPAFVVALDRTKSGHTLPQGANAMVVFAATDVLAKQAAAAKYESDGAAWLNDSTATEIVANTDWNGWTFKVDILGGFGAGTDPASVSVVGTADTNTIDEIGAALVTALNALPVIANASYNAGTNVLTIASAADGLGAQAVQVSITPPGGANPIPGLVGAIVDRGNGGTKATGTLTGETIAADNTVTVDGVTYTFKAALTNPAVPNEVLVGVDDSASLDNLIAAINGAAGAGSTYATGSTKLTSVVASAGAGDTMVLTAATGGLDGNTITTTASLAAGGFAAATLENGNDTGPLSVVLPADNAVIPKVAASFAQV